MKVRCLLLCLSLICSITCSYGESKVSGENDKTASTKEALNDYQTASNSEEPKPVDPQKVSEENKTVFKTINNTPAEIYSEDGKLLMKFDSHLTTKVYDNGTISFFDSSDKLVTTIINGSNNTLKIFDGDNKLVHTFELPPNYSQIYPGKADDIFIMDRQGNPLDAYNLHTPELLAKNPGKGFVSVGDLSKNIYDSKGNFVTYTPLFPKK